MRASRKQNRVEWGFVLLLLALCAVLTALQYRWTGEVSRAEAARLRAGLSEQAQALARAFDTELGEACTALKPTRTEFGGADREAAWFTRYRDWRAANPHPLFRRIAIAVPAHGGIELLTPDEPAGKTVRMEWPPEWSALREHVARMLNGGLPAFNDPTGGLMEFPIFGGRSGSGAGESGWLLLQLDVDYVRNTWLPGQVRTRLGFGGPLPYDVTVAVASTGRELFSSGQPVADDPAAFAVRFHRQGWSAENPRSGRGGPPGPHGTGEGVWVLRARAIPGALESVVSVSRRRNLGVAVAVNGLILAAGVALVIHTRRSRELAAAQMNFVAAVSHELRTPLTVIRGAGHNLLRGIAREPDQIAQYSQLIVRHAEQLGEMVEQTLALAGAGRGGMSSPGGPVDLAAVLAEAVAATAGDTQAAQCEVQLELPPTLPAVTGDAAALRRVFQNLIANAAKHAGEGRWIGITATDVKGAVPPVVEVSVTDRGPGIPAEEQAGIFKPFFRGATAQARQTRGSGLGLSVVREIVGAHRGTVTVASGAGHGASFTVRLPATP